MFFQHRNRKTRNHAQTAWHRSLQEDEDDHWPPSSSWSERWTPQQAASPSILSVVFLCSPLIISSGRPSSSVNEDSSCMMGEDVWDHLQAEECPHLHGGADCFNNRLFSRGGGESYNNCIPEDGRMSSAPRPMGGTNAMIFRTRLHCNYPTRQTLSRKSNGALLRSFYLVNGINVSPSSLAILHPLMS